MTAVRTSTATTMKTMNPTAAVPGAGETSAGTRATLRVPVAELA